MSVCNQLLTRWGQLSLILLLCLLPIYGYAANAQISLQLKWKHQFQFAGYYMALEKGYYRDAGLDVTLIEGGPGRSSIEHVANEQGAYGVTGTGALIERSRGKPVKAIGAIFQHSPLGKGSSIILTVVIIVDMIFPCRGLCA